MRKICKFSVFVCTATGHLVAVHFKQGDKSATYFAETDHLGSVMKLVDSKVHSKYEARYTPFGVRTIVKNDLGYNFPRGYTMHEHLDQFGVINANARLYDPYLARFLSPDPYIQEPTNPQNFNRFSYCLNNPLKYTDPTGEFVWLPFVIGGIIGGIQGCMIGKSSGLSDWGIFATTVFGAGIGAASAGFGSYVSSSAGVMANTLSVVGGSYYNSIGMSMLGGFCGQNIPLSINFGAGSLTFGANGIELGYLGKKGNQWYENLGYGVGAMANVSDFLVGFNRQNIDDITLRTQYDPNNETFESCHKDLIGHTQISGKRNIILVDWGPTESKTSYFGRLACTNNYENGILIGNQTGCKFWNPIELKHVNYKRILTISKRLSAKNKGYNLFYNSCVSMGSRALNATGIFNIGIHPYLLHSEMYLRQLGFRPSLFSYYLKH